MSSQNVRASGPCHSIYDSLWARYQAEKYIPIVTEIRSIKDTALGLCMISGGTVLKVIDFINGKKSGPQFPFGLSADLIFDIGVSVVKVSVPKLLPMTCTLYLACTLYVVSMAWGTKAVRCLIL